MANVKSSGFRKKAASLLAAAALALFPSPSRSYEPGTVGNPSTHPLLSRKSAELYMNSPHHEEDPNGRRINIRDLEKGTIEEDSPAYRSVHHFMEWNTGRGLDPIISAKEWALDEEAQTAFWGGNYTWPRAVREQDVESLGHILHLIQDLSVPAHTRDDAHPGFFSKLEDADSELERELILALNPNHEDSYELWAHENRGKISQLTPETVPYYNRLEDIFDHMANVSGSLFLSDDTTFETGKYPSPRGGDVTARRIAGRQYYMANIARKEVPLARKGFLREYVLDHYVLNEQWRILGTKAVEMGAAAIQLYFESIGGENPDQPECIPRERLECQDNTVYQADNCGSEQIYERCEENQRCVVDHCEDVVQGECENGQREQQSCDRLNANNNGTLERRCVNQQWQYGECADPDQCVLGEQRTSYSGPRGTAEVGECRSKLEDCVLQNGRATFRVTRNEVLPQEELCENGIDEDCDGGDVECPCNPAEGCPQQNCSFYDGFDELDLECRWNIWEGNPTVREGYLTIHRNDHLAGREDFPDCQDFDLEVRMKTRGLPSFERQFSLTYGDVKIVTQDNVPTGIEIKCAANNQHRLNARLPQIEQWNTVRIVREGGQIDLFVNEGHVGSDDCPPGAAPGYRPLVRVWGSDLELHIDYLKIICN